MEGKYLFRGWRPVNAVSHLDSSRVTKTSTNEM